MGTTLEKRIPKWFVLLGCIAVFVLSLWGYKRDTVSEVFPKKSSLLVLTTTIENVRSIEAEQFSIKVSKSLYPWRYYIDFGTKEPPLFGTLQSSKTRREKLDTLKSGDIVKVWIEPDHLKGVIWELWYIGPELRQDVLVSYESEKRLRQAKEVASDFNIYVVGMFLSLGVFLVVLFVKSSNDKGQGNFEKK